MNSDSPLRTIKFRPLPRSRKTERMRPLKTIHIAPPPRGEKHPLKTIHIAPPPRSVATHGALAPSAQSVI